MPRAKQLEGLNAVAAQVVVSSPALQARLEAIFARMLDEVEYTMVHGAPHARAAMMRSVVPYLFRGFTDAAAMASSDEERAAVDRIMQSLRDG